MDVEDTNYEVFSEIMELIFDGVSYQSPEMTIKDVTKTLANKKRKLKKNVNLFRSDSFGGENDFDNDEKSMDSRQYAKLKDSNKQVLIGHKIPIGVKLFTE